MTASQSAALPTVELLPLHAAIMQQKPMTLDVLVRITPPDLQLDTADRPPMNLSLVIDRSGSMGRTKMESARNAAAFAVKNLLPCDRISVVLFDDRIETLIASTLATDKNTLLRRIDRIRSRGSTALHGGWVEGGTQVSHYLNPDCLNRVILLSDGLANVGEARPDVIANDVHELAQRGVSTTALGIGSDYSEDLLVAIARSGDGNFFHIESPEQLPDIFETEFAGLTATLGQRVSLGFEPKAGVRIADVLNDFEQTSTQRYKLPNLMVGTPINVVVRLQIPALSEPTELLSVRLAWDDSASKQRQVMKAGLELPLVSLQQLSDFPANALVQEQVALLMAARARQEAIDYTDHGDLGAASTSITYALTTLSDLYDVTESPELLEEQQALEDLNNDYRTGDVRRARKKAASQAYNLFRSGQSHPRRSLDS